jgi:hypothetical protein
MIINSYILSSASTVSDPDAQLFITAAAITDNTQKNAINNLVINLKAAGIWGKMKAIYPFVGGTASSHKWNLKDPRDLDAAFRLVFNGGWTHSANGATPNGTNGYANTFLFPNTSLTISSAHFAKYNRNNDLVGNKIDGTLDNSNVQFFQQNYSVGNGIIGSSASMISYTATDTRGLFTLTRTSSSLVKVFRNNTQIASNTTAITALPINTSIFIGARNDGSPVYYNSYEAAFASIGDGLTDTEALVFNQIVEGYQYALSRNINPINANYYNTSYTNETNAFLYASEITDNTQKNAINTLVVNMKAAGIWSKMKAVYPFVGGTASTHKWNLINPQDTNAAFRLSFLGGWTHTSNGVQANGTNGYADTFFNPNTGYSVNDNAHISVYSRSNQSQTDADFGCQTGSDYLILSIRRADQSNNTFYGTNSSNFAIYSADPDSLGFYVANRIGTSNKGFKNSTNVASNTLSATTRPNASVYLSNINAGGPNAGLYSNKQFAFGSIGDGLTDTEALLFNQIVETYQYALSRNVNPTNPNYYTTSYANETNIFLYASEITDNTQKNAINNLVVNMKAAGIWTKMKAIYPMIGGTASTHKWNLVNPQDIDAAYRLTFTGGWTHSSTGALPNGTNAFGNTFLANNNMGLNSIHYSYYSRSNTTAAPMQEMGSLQDSAATPPLVGNSYSDLGVRNSGGGAFIRLNDGGGATFVANLDSRGFYTGTRTGGNTIKLFKNGSNIQSLLTASNSVSNIPIYIGALNFRGTSASAYSNRECAFSSIGDGLTDSEALLFNQIVETYQYALSRNINPVNANYYTTSYANETNVFLYASEITDNTQKTAINNLVVNMKAAGIWSKMKAVYPFIGGTASTHKWNLVNPQDIDAAFRLVFNGGWTHSSNGVTPNGTNGYADTKLNMSTNYTVNDSTHISFYSRDSFAGFQDYEMGVYNSSTGIAINLVLRRSDFSNTTFYTVNSNSSLNYIDSNAAAFYISNRLGTAMNGWRNSTKTVTTTSAAGTRPSLNMFIGNLNIDGAPNGGLWGTRQCAFASIGDGLTDSEALAFNQIVETYQYALGRNINPVNANYYSTAYNPETNTFLYASEITNNAQKTAVDTLITDLKAAGIWTKMKAVYPFVGGTASTHKWNLVNPQDTDAAFRLIFNGGWTHDSNGVQGNGTNGYADTFYNLSLHSTANNISNGVYCRTNSIGNFASYGAENSSVIGSTLVIKAADNNTYYSVNDPLGAGTGNFISDTRGFFVNTRLSTNPSNQKQLFRNGSSVNIFASGANIPNNLNLVFNARNQFGSINSYDNRSYAFFFLGDNISAAEAANFYTAVQKYNTSLARNI